MVQVARVNATTNATRITASTPAHRVGPGTRVAATSRRPTSARARSTAPTPGGGGVAGASAGRSVPLDRCRSSETQEEPFPGGESAATAHPGEAEGAETVEPPESERLANRDDV